MSPPVAWRNLLHVILSDAKDLLLLSVIAVLPKNRFFVAALLRMTFVRQGS
jgi:hypothetical protein